MAGEALRTLLFRRMGQVERTAVIAARDVSTHIAKHRLLPCKGELAETRLGREAAGHNLQQLTHVDRPAACAALPPGEE